MPCRSLLARSPGGHISSTLLIISHIFARFNHCLLQISQAAPLYSPSLFCKKLLTPGDKPVILFIVRGEHCCAGVAQLVEQLICNQQVGGSNPSTSSISPFQFGGVPKWPKGTDCKSAGFAFDGSNPSSSTSYPLRHSRRGLLRLAAFCLCSAVVLLSLGGPPPICTRRWDGRGIPGGERERPTGQAG